VTEPPDADRCHLRVGPARVAASCIAAAARYGFTLAPTPETPVEPEEGHPWLTQRGTWGRMDTMVLYGAAIGCAWVHLRFAIDDQRRALVRYEAKPAGEPLPDWRLSARTVGFDRPASSAGPRCQSARTR
jgi:hypothetical protein